MLGSWGQGQRPDAWGGGGRQGSTPAAKRTGKEVTVPDWAGAGRTQSCYNAPPKRPVSTRQLRGMRRSRKAGHTHQGKAEQRSGLGVTDAGLHTPPKCPRGCVHRAGRELDSGTHGGDVTRTVLSVKGQKLEKSQRKILEPRSTVARGRDSRMGRRKSWFTWTSAKITEAENRAEPGQEHRESKGAAAAAAGQRQQELCQA